MVKAFIANICLLGNDIEPLSSIEYLRQAADIIPIKNPVNDKENFVQIKNLLIETLSLIENINNLTKGEENLIGNIAQDLENSLGLINLQVK